jgi:lipoyl-dependent peroxiredoxin
MSKNTANAVWQGNLTEGTGEVALGLGAFKGQFSFKSRFEDGVGTNPEELIAAAHAIAWHLATHWPKRALPPSAWPPPPKWF